MVLGHELDVFAELRYNEDNERFILGYGAFEGRPTCIGVGGSLGEAVEHLAECVDGPDGPKRRVRRTLRKGDETSLKFEVYHISDYRVRVADKSGNEVVGVGRNMPKALHDLSEKVEVRLTDSQGDEQ